MVQRTRCYSRLEQYMSIILFFGVFVNREFVCACLFECFFDLTVTQLGYHSVVYFCRDHRLGSLMRPLLPLNLLIAQFFRR